MSCANGRSLEAKNASVFAQIVVCRRLGGNFRWAHFLPLLQFVSPVLVYSAFLCFIPA